VSRLQLTGTRPSSNFQVSQVRYSPRHCCRSGPVIVLPTNRRGFAD
jgi:hypothetical protein